MCLKFQFVRINCEKIHCNCIAMLFSKVTQYAAFTKHYPAADGLGNLQSNNTPLHYMQLFCSWRQFDKQLRDIFSFSCSCKSSCYKDTSETSSILHIFFQIQTDSTSRIKRTQTMQSSLGVKTLLQDPALVSRTKSFSAEPKPPVKKPRPLSGIENSHTPRQYTHSSDTGNYLHRYL